MKRRQKEKIADRPSYILESGLVGKLTNAKLRRDVSVKIKTKCSIKGGNSLLSSHPLHVFHILTPRK